MSARAVLLGAPGAGKGTQARRVCERLGLAHLSTGDMLRAAAAAGTPAGRRAAACMERGELVPDEIVFGVLFDRLAGDVDGFVLDGFPRNRAQAVELDRRLEAAGTPLDMVIDLDVPDARLAGRITGRRVCRRCGRNYHVEHMPSRQSGRCDSCGGETYQRKDDTAETVAQRLAVYHAQTAPLKGHYEDLGLLTRVDGDRSPDQVTEQLLATLRAATARAGGGG